MVFAGHQIGILVFLGGLLLVALSNWRALRRISAFPPPPSPLPPPRVSILVPARNEEANIEACVRSLLAQTYPNFELLVLDDASTDRTGAILAGLEAESAGRLRVLAGTPLPPGWLGKLWACEQLAQAAQGELLLFVDADTRHHAHMLADGVQARQAEAADLLTALPHEETCTWGERLTVPLIAWSLFCFLPLAVAHRIHWPPLSAAIGQFMLFRRAAYEAVGGHASVRRNSAEDLALARRIIAQGLRWRLVDATQRSTCRMYTGFKSAFYGLSKSLLAAFDYRLGVYVPVWLWVGLVFLEPPLVLGLRLLGLAPGFSAELALLGVGLAMLLWALFCLRLGYPLYLVLLYPLVIGLALGVVGVSIWQRVRGTGTWKGRTI